MHFAQIWAAKHEQIYTIVDVPKDILRLFCYPLATKDVSHLALTNKHFCQEIFSDNELWNLFLKKHFPSSRVYLKPGVESLTLYKHYLVTLPNNIESGRYQLQTLNQRSYSLVTYDDKLIFDSGHEIIIQDLNTGKELQVLRGHQNNICYLVVHDSNLISKSWDNEIKIWDLKTGKELQTLLGHKNAMEFLVPYDNKLIFTSGQEIIIQDLNGEKDLQTLNGHQYDIKFLTVYENKLISSSYDDGITKIWNPNTGEELQTIEHIPFISITVCDGKLIYGGRDYNTSSKSSHEIHILDLNTGKHLQVMRGHDSSTLCLTAFSNFIFSGTRDKTIRIWNAKTGKILQTLPKQNPNNLIFYDGKLISTENNTIKIFNFLG